MVIDGIGSEERCEVGNLAGLQLWTMPSRRRIWRCDCGKEESGDCLGWKLRAVLRRVRNAERDPDEPVEPKSWRIKVLPLSEWKGWWRDRVSSLLGLPETGVLLKRGLLCRPSRLGEFLRQFSSAQNLWPSGGRREMRDPMPLPIPMMTGAEEEWERL